MTKHQLPQKIAGPEPAEPYASLIRQFLSHLYQSGHSTATIASYGWHLNKLGIWLIEQEIINPSDISPAVLIAWGEKLRRKYASQTHKQAAIAAKSFFKFLVDIRQCPEVILHDVEKFLAIPKTNNKIQRTFTQSEVETLLSADADSVIGARNVTIMALLLDTGLRASELCSIQIHDVELNKQRIRIMGKGGNEEFVYFSEKCYPLLKNWLEVRTSIKTDSKNVFVSIGGTSPGKPLTTRGLRTIVKNAGEQAGIVNVHPHAFRRTFATLRIKNGQSTRGVQRLGRWKNLSTFERYTRALLIDEEYARSEANSFSPLP